MEPALIHAIRAETKDVAIHDVPTRIVAPQMLNVPNNFKSMKKITPTQLATDDQGKIHGGFSLVHFGHGLSKITVANNNPKCENKCNKCVNEGCTNTQCNNSGTCTVQNAQCH